MPKRKRSVDSTWLNYNNTHHQYVEYVSTGFNHQTCKGVDLEGLIIHPGTATLKVLSLEVAGIGGTLDSYNVCLTCEPLFTAGLAQPVWVLTLVIELTKSTVHHPVAVSGSLDHWSYIRTEQSHASFSGFSLHPQSCDRRQHKFRPSAHHQWNI